MAQISKCSGGQYGRYVGDICRLAQRNPCLGCNWVKRSDDSSHTIRAEHSQHFL